MEDNQKKVLYETIGKVIGKSIKEIKGLTQAEFAKAIDMNRATLSNIIAGRQQVSIHLLYDIAKSLNIQPWELMPSLETLDTKFIEQGVQFDKLLDETDISQKSKKAILDIINQPK